ncbi:hypothetical protein ACSBR1_022624 [Camellia fascicularis]
MIWYAVTTAENGQRALELLGLGDRQHIINSNKKKKDSKVNLIITDYCMTGMIGYELLKKVKITSNALRALMIFTNILFNLVHLNRCMKERAQEFRQKPLQQSDIKKLRRHMTKFSKPTNGRLCMGS